MDAALDLFAEKDYAAVTMQDIARASGLTYSLIYYYFRNKEDLFKSTMRHLIARTMENYAQIRAKHDDPVDLIEDWFANNLELSAPLRKLVKIMFDYSGPRGRSLAVDKAIGEFYAEERGILAASIRDGIARGLFQPVDPEQAAAFVSTHIDGIFFGSTVRPDVDLAEAMERLRTVLWQLLGHRRSAAARRRSA